MIRSRHQLATASRAFGAARRFAFAASLACVAAGFFTPGPARAQSAQDDAPAMVDDKFFDCAQFKALIDSAPKGFADERGAQLEDSDQLTRFAALRPLFGACEVTLKKKTSEVVFSCQAAKVEIPDLKATIDACLGADAGPSVNNENPKTPFLRYSPRQGGGKVKVLALTTFGKKTVAIIATP